MNEIPLVDNNIGHFCKTTPHPTPKDSKLKCKSAREPKDKIIGPCSLNRAGFPTLNSLGAGGGEKRALRKWSDNFVSLQYESI